MNALNFVCVLKKDKRMHATAEQIKTDGQNLQKEFKRLSGLYYIIHRVPTKKAAEDLAAIWNAQYISNGQHMTPEDLYIIALYANNN